MKKIDSFFDVFSRRSKKQSHPSKKLTSTFRNRVLMFCRDTYGEAGFGRNFWEETYKKLQYLHGRTRLIDVNVDDTPFADVFAFLLSCSDEHFFDFLEFLFKSEFFWQAHLDEEEMVDNINNFFRIDNLPFAITKFVRETRMESLGIGDRTERPVSVVVVFPKVIRRDDDVMHISIIEPTLTLLHNKAFISANVEFLEALEDFRKGDYGDCLTKCGSALESTLKLICDQKRWSYNQKDTAAILIKTVITNSELDSFFEQPLSIIATLRNRLSKSHGAGVEERIVPEHLARFTVNSTATVILLLIEHCLG